MSRGPGTPFLRLAAAILLAGLAACGSSKPDPTELSIAFAASPQLNPNELNEPSPAVVRIYELKGTDAFRAADFFALYDNDIKTLGSDMLGKKEFTLKPGQELEYAAEISGESRFLGVMVGYRNIQDAKWQITAPVKPESSNTIRINVDALAVTLVEEKKPWWKPW